MQLTTTPTGKHDTATFWLSHAWLGTHVEPGVTLDVADGRIAGVRTGVDAPPPGATVLRGLTLPGLANAHSHAFHRALRSTVQVGSGTFWTWRELMYQVSSRLTPRRITTSPAPCTPRWRWPASPTSVSSTICTTRRVESRTTTRTRWARP